MQAAQPTFTYLCHGCSDGNMNITVEYENKLPIKTGDIDWSKYKNIPSGNGTTLRELKLHKY